MQQMPFWGFFHKIFWEAFPGIPQEGSRHRRFVYGFAARNNTIKFGNGSAAEKVVVFYCLALAIRIALHGGAVLRRIKTQQYFNNFVQ